MFLVRKNSSNRARGKFPKDKRIIVIQRETKDEGTGYGGKELRKRLEKDDRTKDRTVARGHWTFGK